MRAPIAALLALLSLLAPVALARPAAEQHLGATLVERGSAHYRFEHFELASADGQRHYRVRLGIPGAPPRRTVIRCSTCSTAMPPWRPCARTGWPSWSRARHRCWC